MTAEFLARLTLTCIAAGQGSAPLFVDLNRTHATNPAWTGHARFHVVWQTCTQLPMAAIEVALVWCPGPLIRSRFYLAALLTATSLAGFVLAMLFRPLYGGTLRDPNGVQPVRFHLGSRRIEIDMNVPAVATATVLLLGAVVVFWTSH
jgi:hypothetical protein